MRLITGIGIGAGLMYFFDPQQGRSRRAQLAQRLGGKARRSAEEFGRRSEYIGGQFEGLKHAARNFTSDDRPPESDRALVDKIESEVLSRSQYPKSNIVIDAVDGIVSLRGQVDTPQQIDEIEQEVRKISGVIEVDNFLHLPNTPAPNKRDAIDR